MAEEGRKVARGLGIAAIVGGAILLATKVKAKPPAPPEPPEPGLANLYGVVTDVVTGRAVPGVLITLNGIEAHTFDDGSYSLVDLEPKKYALLVFSKEGYKLFNLFNVAIIEGNNKLNVEMTPIAAPEEPTPGLANLYGKVTDADTGAALQGVKVTVGSLVIYTNSSGYYSFTNLEPSNYTVKFSKEGYETAVY